MTNEEFEFKEDSKRFKGVKGPQSGDKKCTLPHETLSPAQLKKKNGSEISSQRPTKIADFQSASESWQKFHLEYLVTRFSATEKMLQNYLQLSNRDMAELLEHLDVVPAGKADLRKIGSEWSAFIHCNPPRQKRVYTRKKPVTPPAPTVRKPALQENNIQTVITITMSGRKEDIVWILRSLESTNIKLHINVD